MNPLRKILTEAGLPEEWIEDMPPENAEWFGGVFIAGRYPVISTTGPAGFLVGNWDEHGNDYHFAHVSTVVTRIKEREGAEQ